MTRKKISVFAFSSGPLTAVIFEEFGIDKTSGVLDPAQAGGMFDGMSVEAILNPDK